MWQSLWLLPAEVKLFSVMEQYLVINDLTLYYKKKGEAKQTLIFFHPSSANADIWDAQWNDERFKDYSLLCFDYPGHGRSSHSTQPDRDYLISAIANTLLQAIEQLGIQEYILISLSLGCNIAGEIADITTGCQGFFMAGGSIIGGELLPSHALLPFEYGAVLLTSHPAAMDLDNYTKGLVYSQDETILSGLQLMYQNTDPAFRTTLAQSISQRQWTNEIQKLSDSHKPVALIFGENEKITSSSYLDEVPLFRWGNKTWIIAQAGHLVNLDQPALFNQLLLAFAKEVLPV